MKKTLKYIILFLIIILTLFLLNKVWDKDNNETLKNSELKSWIDITNNIVNIDIIKDNSFLKDERFLDNTEIVSKKLKEFTNWNLQWSIDQKIEQ